MFDECSVFPAAYGGHHWRLIDPRPIRRDNPYTFFTAPADEINALEPGDHINLMVEKLGDPPGSYERIWIVFEGRDAAGYYGCLDRDAIGIPGLAPGDPVRFQAHHIVSLWEPRLDGETVELGPDELLMARCRVDPRVPAGESRIGRIERHPPKRRASHHWKPDVYPDSGWRIFAEDGRRISRPAKMLYLSLDAVMHADDSVLPHLDAPVGTCLVRDGVAFRLQ